MIVTVNAAPAVLLPAAKSTCRWVGAAGATSTPLLIPVMEPNTVQTPPPSVVHSVALTVHVPALMNGAEMVVEPLVQHGGDPHRVPGISHLTPE